MNSCQFSLYLIQTITYILKGMALALKVGKAENYLKYRFLNSTEAVSADGINYIINSEQRCLQKLPFQRKLGVGPAASFASSFCRR